jgi:hypothetical protein
MSFSSKERGEGPNCMGFVCYKLGLIDQDQYVDGGDYFLFLKKYGFEEVDTKQDAQVAVMAFEPWTELPGHRGVMAVYHVAFIDPDGETVTHRPGIGDNIEVMSLAQMISEHEEGLGDRFHLKYWRVKTHVG